MNDDHVKEIRKVDMYDIRAHRLFNLKDLSL